MKILTTDGRGTVEGCEFYMLCGPVAGSFATLSSSYQLHYARSKACCVRPQQSMERVNPVSILFAYREVPQASPLLGSFMAGMCGGPLIF